MNDKDKITAKENSRVYVLFYSFFLVPFMIAIFGAVFFLLFKFITFESNNAYDYLNDIRSGSASKRWQSAYELSKILSQPDLIPLERDFDNQMISAYDKSVHDNPKVRTYLALAMGQSRHATFGPSLLAGMKDEDRISRLAAIQAIGMIQYEPAVPSLSQVISKSEIVEERLASTIALGKIGSKASIPTLKLLLDDPEANIRWDAAIALGKMGDKSGANIIVQLLDRDFFTSYPEVDEQEKIQAILVAINMAAMLPDSQFENQLVKLASSEPNLMIRDAAIKSLKSAYE
jgi:hypothetical protein